ncbi:hypothetical protein C0J52_10758 [Blattella germanica]|nr:hypothetical protein C0J52_10758 [Blattella germanica]
MSCIAYEDMSNNITKYTKITGVLNKFFKPSQVQRHTRLKMYKTLARPVLTYGSEEWTIKKTNEKRLTAAEMRFKRRTAGCSLLEHRRNAEILEEVKIYLITEYVQHYRRNWKSHVQWMNNNRVPKQILIYNSRGHRNLGRPMKR